MQEEEDFIRATRTNAKRFEVEKVVRKSLACLRRWGGRAGEV